MSHYSEEQPKPASSLSRTTSKPIFEFSTDEELDGLLSETKWLWPGYIPRGYLTGLVADQDQGKSNVAQSLCQTVISGGRWPDGQLFIPEPDTYGLWLDTEGSLALWRERARKWGIPKGRFVFPKDPLQELRIDDATSWRWIEGAIEKFNPPLVVIDSLSGAHQARENNNDEMKAVTKRLAKLAQTYQIAVVAIHHLNKVAPGVPDYPITLGRTRGASATTQFCRSVLALGTPDKNQPLRRRLDVIKLNLAKKPAPVGYELTDIGPVWGEAPEVPQERRAIDDALDFLETALANGPRPSDELMSEAKAQGIGSNALRDAKKAMNIKAKLEGSGKKEGRWFWVVPSSHGSSTVLEEEGVA